MTCLCMAKYDMTTFDEVLVKSSGDFMDKQKKTASRFCMAYPPAWQVSTFLSQKYGSHMNFKTNYGLKKPVLSKWTMPSVHS
jgi:arylsulfatase